jgi:hypothetical protein
MIAVEKVLCEEGVIKEVRFRVEQRLKILREADQSRAAAVAKKYDVSNRMVYASGSESGNASR